MVEIVVPGRPVPAVRMTQRSKFANRAAGRYLAYKFEVGLIAKREKVKRFDGPVEVEAIAYLHGGREPDVDNLAKSYLDSLNGIAWDDDRQVRKLTVMKIKAEKADEQKSIIRIKEAE
jgi:crossover junction endodeoxyribonuclease RusA